MPPRRQAAGQVLDLLKQCGVDGWPRSDAERTGEVSVAVVSSASPCFFAVSGKLWTLVAKLQREGNKL